MKRRRLLHHLALLALSPLTVPGRRGQASTEAGRAPLDVDLSPLAPGEAATRWWGEDPVFVHHRTPAQIEAVRRIPVQELRDPETDAERTQRPEWLVVLGRCTHAGCIPEGPMAPGGGWYCFCHGSRFDGSGRVLKGPARRNLAVPPHRFLAPMRLRIGTAPETG